MWETIVNEQNEQNEQTHKQTERQTRPYITRLYIHFSSDDGTPVSNTGTPHMTSCTWLKGGWYLSRDQQIHDLTWPLLTTSLSRGQPEIWVKFPVEADVCIILYNTMQYSIIQYNAIQYKTTIQYYAIQYYTIRYYTILYKTVLYNTLHYITIQCSTIQHSTIQCNTLQYSTTQ